MPIITTDSGRKVFRKAESLLVIPYVYNSTYNEYVLGNTAYDLSAIIGDSIVIEESDGDTQTKECEFYREPIVKNVTKGETNVTAQCLDLQNDVLKALFGAYYNDTIGAAAMRNDYTTMYALIRIRFSGASEPDVYLPQVLLNSKLFFQQLRTRGAQGNLAGTALSRTCSVVGTSPNLVQFTDPTNGENTYQVDTPILFVPKGQTPLFLNHIDNTNQNMVFDEVNDAAGDNDDCCYHNRVVSNNNRGVYTIQS